MALNSHDYDERQTVSLKDLSENGKEKLADLSDEELQQLKQHAVEAEDYDIAKMIKQEQTERKERLTESDDSQESDWQTQREEAWKNVHKKIQEEKNASREEDLKKAKILTAQLNDWEESKNEKENKLNEISDDEILKAAQTIHEITEWRYRDNDRMLRKIWEFPTEEDVPWMRKYMEEHPENWIIDKASYYTKVLEDISDLIKASIKEYEKRWRLIWDTKSIEHIMKWVRSIGDNLEEAGMKDSPQFEKVISIYKYFSKQKSTIEEYLNLPGPSRRRR